MQRHNRNGKLPWIMPEGIHGVVLAEITPGKTGKKWQVIEPW